MVFANAPPIGLAVLEVALPPLPALLDALLEVAVLEVALPPLPALLDALLEVAVLEVALPPLPALLDGCAGPIKALFESGPVLGIYLL